jgi:hypothetical protein
MNTRRRAAAQFDLWRHKAADNRRTTPATYAELRAVKDQGGAPAVALLLLNMTEAAQKETAEAHAAHIGKDAQRVLKIYNNWMNDYVRTAHEEVAA